MDVRNYGNAFSPPMSAEGCAEIRQQLERILETHHFKNSRRYAPLLRFIIEETLAGRGEFLKERLLGVRVFDRPTNYDTATDPVVRVTIAEIRKRIAQYYHDEKHDGEIRIELLPGRYAPEFRSRTISKDSVAVPGPAGLPEVGRTGLLAREPLAAALPAETSRRFRTTGLLLAVMVLLLGALLWVPVSHWLYPSALDELWSPFIASHHPILICLPISPSVKSSSAGDHNPGVHTPGPVNSKSQGETFLDYETLAQNVNYSDVLATSRISNVLAEHGQDNYIRLSDLTSFEDLRQGPAVLIGGVSNQWSKLALSPLRYRFAGSDKSNYWISDAKNPAVKSWSLDLKLNYKAVTHAYGIVARVHNETTGEPEMVVAGLGMSGTAAAGEFVADAGHAEEIRERVGPHFKDRDFEAVIATDVVDGVAGPPRILTVWVR